MQLGCNASEAGSLLFCCVCTKKCFLSNIFMASCKLFIVQRQRSSHRNCPYGFGKGSFRIRSRKNYGQHGQGKCCLEVVWKVIAWEALYAGCITSHMVGGQSGPQLSCNHVYQISCSAIKKDLSVYLPAGELQEGEKEITLHLQYLVILGLRQK